MIDWAPQRRTSEGSRARSARTEARSAGCVGQPMGERAAPSSSHAASSRSDDGITIALAPDHAKIYGAANALVDTRTVMLTLR